MFILPEGWSGRSRGAVSGAKGDAVLSRKVLEHADSAASSVEPVDMARERPWNVTMTMTVSP